MIVRVPASSANLGPGFDALGMALTLSFELSDTPIADAPGARDLEPSHPAARAFAAAGGTGALWARSPIPAGRGLGFSGAARVAGIVGAFVQRHGNFDRVHHGTEVLALGTELEGHADNVAASLLGGIVATCDGCTVRVPLGFDPAVVCWVPENAKTSTDESRATLGSTVPFFDAVFNVGRVALLVAALADGNERVLRHATQDRLHQDVRFQKVPASRAALDIALEAGAWCGWLSGSGPTIATFCPVPLAESIAAALPTQGGHAKVLRIDHAGAVVER